MALPADAPKIAGVHAGDLPAPERTEAGGGTVLRYRLKDETPLSVAQKSGGWDIALAQPPVKLADMPWHATGSDDEVRISAPGSAKVISLNDPEIGDILKIMPLPTAGEHIARPHRFADAAILPAAQGVVVAVQSDRLTVTAGLGSIILGGMNVLNDAGMAGAAPPGLFAFKEWHTGTPFNIVQQRQAIQKASIDQTGANLEAPMIDLAKLYIGNGYGNEALGVLEYTASVEPDVTTSPDYVALHGAAAALAGRKAEAITDFTSDAIRLNPEAQMWKGFAEAMGNGDERQEALSILRPAGASIEAYPFPIKHRFALALAALAIDAHDPGGMQAAIDLLAHGNSPSDLGVAAATDALKGAMAMSANKPEAAMKLFNDIPRLRDQLWIELGGFRRRRIRAG